MLLVAAQGPKGMAVARELGDGLITVGPDVRRIFNGEVVFAEELQSFEV